MADFIKNIRQRFDKGDVLIKLIFINIAVFIVFGIFNVICILFEIKTFDLSEYIGVPASWSKALTHPWTFFSYMFVHANLLHILFNMLLLYWFGKIFLSYFSQKNLGGLYVLGGLGGAALYIIAFNTIPFYINMGNSVMIGASASVTAIIFAAAFYRPNAEITMLLLGRIKIIYIALFFFILDFLELKNPSNPGGHVAHIGGAAVGFLFARQYLKGKDITAWMNRLIDIFVNLFKKKPVKLKVKTTNNKRSSEYEYNQQKQQRINETDAILDKIKASGYNSLTNDEKKTLFDASNK